jgi:DNA-directed RNA polymerase subunit beta
LVSIKIVGRLWAKAYESIVKDEPIKKPKIPESFNVLIRELQSLGLAVKFENTKVAEEDEYEGNPELEAIPELDEAARASLALEAEVNQKLAAENTEDANIAKHVSGLEIMTDQDSEDLELDEIKEGGDPSDLEDFAKMEEPDLDQIEPPDEELMALAEDPDEIVNIDLPELPEDKE